MDPTSRLDDILISVLIVNYKVGDYLREALRSLRQAELYEKCEVIVVDNASNDRSREMVTSEFSAVQWIQLKSNIGFGKACNVGAQNAKGEYLLILNPDTVISRSTLCDSVAFLRAHPEVGLMGPKVLNPDGTLQASCRRSFPTPSVAFYHFTGISKIFPKSKKFGRYNLTFMDLDSSSQVDAISGSFMFMTRALFASIGGFDERFFMYGEDLDICWRIKEKGLKVWYNPEINIIHLKGKSSAKSQFRSRIAFYEAMVIFSQKYRHTRGSFFPGWLIFVGIITQACFNIAGNLLKASTAWIIDILLLNSILWGGISLRFQFAHEQSPYHSGSLVMLMMHLLLSACFVFMFAYNGIYSRKKYSVTNALLSGIFASVLFMASVYFIKAIAFSRIAFGISSLAISFLLVGYREIQPKAGRRIRQWFFPPDRVIIVGKGPIASSLIKNMEMQKTTSIAGIIWDDSPHPGEFKGYPVLGVMKDIRSVLDRYEIDMLLIATPVPWYSLVIETLGASRVKDIIIRWVPQELFNRENELLPEVIPLRDFSV